MSTSIGNSNFHTPASASSHSFSVTIGAGSVRKLVIVASRETSATITGVTFNGVAMNQRLAFLPTSLGAYAYDYDIPAGTAEGTYTVVVSLSASSSAFQYLWWELLNAASGAPEATETNSLSGTNISQTITSTAGAARLALAVSSATAVGTWSWSGVTARTEVTTGSTDAGIADASNVASGSQSVTATYSATGTDLRLVLLSYSAVSGGGGGDTARRRTFLQSPKNTRRAFTKPYRATGFLYGATQVVESGGGGGGIPSATFAYILNPLEPLFRQDAPGPAVPISNERFYTIPRLRFQGLAADLVGDQDYRGFSVVLPAVTRTDTN